MQVRWRYGAGTVQVRCRSVQVRCRYGGGTVQVRCRYGAGTMQVRCRYDAAPYLFREGWNPLGKRPPIRCRYGAVVTSHLHGKHITTREARFEAVVTVSVHEWQAHLCRHFGPSWGAVGALLGALWAVLELSLAVLGLSWASLGALLGPLGAILRPRKATKSKTARMHHSLVFS